MKSNQPWIRRSQRVIRLVSELHRMGYHRLRIMPYEYPLAWRLCIGPCSAFSRHNGAFIPRSEPEFPTYSSASENAYFNWQDAKNDNARTFRFEDSLTSIARASPPKKMTLPSGARTAMTASA